MTEIGPKSPRVHDGRYLAWIRTLPCCVCSNDRSDAAHIRSASLEHQKSHTGLGEKPSDFWALPLCRSCHGLQHSMNELEYWKSKGIDPFELAKRYYARAVVLGQTNPGSTSKRKRRKTIVPKGFRRKIQSRGFQ